MENLKMFIWIVKVIIAKYWLIAAVIIIASAALLRYDKKTGKISKLLDL